MENKGVGGNGDSKGFVMPPETVEMTILYNYPLLGLGRLMRFAKRAKIK